MNACHPKQHNENPAVLCSSIKNVIVLHSSFTDLSEIAKNSIIYASLTFMYSSQVGRELRSKFLLHNWN